MTRRCGCDMTADVVQDTALQYIQGAAEHGGQHDDGLSRRQLCVAFASRAWVLRVVETAIRLD